MEMNEEFMIYDLRFTISEAIGGWLERGAAGFKSSIINHQS
jgi:hypothetical protein